VGHEEESAAVYFADSSRSFIASSSATSAFGM
jgi:hypothetical protein